MSVAGFSDVAADEVVAALTQHVAAGQKKIILDLRGNPGGYVTAARKIASQFIGSGVVFWEQDAAGNQVATDALSGGVATDPAIRLVVLDRRRERVGQRDRRGRPAGHRARDAHRRSSRMARGPSSSGSSSPAMAARSG